MADHLSANGTKTKAFAALNCIDLSNPDIQQSAALLKQACLDSGFYYVINHGISEELMDQVLAQSKRFFALPLSKKMKVFRSAKYRGYMPPLEETFDSETNKKDHKEAYLMGVEVSEDDSDADDPFFAPNVWPPADVLPGWKEIMEKYYREAVDVVRAIARIIAVALDLSIDFFDQPEMLAKPIADLRLTYYEGRVADFEKEIPGIAAHTDFGFMSLLATDDVVGLQICRDKDAKPLMWEYVQPLKGAFIVNIGDLMERFSNCVFRSTLHKVIVDEERYSIALFVSPSPNCVVECSPTCKSEEHPPKFSPIKCTEYLSTRTKNSRQGSKEENRVEAAK